MLYEEILNSIGGWGKYQKLLCLLLALSAIPNGYFTMTPVFTNKSPEHRCRIPEIDGYAKNSSTTAQYNASGLDLYIPWDAENNRYESCVRYNQRITLDNATVMQCDEGYVYDVAPGQITAVTEWDLVCNSSHIKPQITAVYMSGILVGSLISGVIADRLGRWPVIISATYLQFVFMGLNIFNTSPAMYAALMFFSGCCSLINFVAAVVLATELVNVEQRALVETAVMLGFSFGYVLLPLFAYFILDWKWILLVGALSGCLYIPYWCLIPESPRWLLTRRKYSEARELIMKIARTNGKNIDIDALLAEENLQLISGTEKPVEKKKFCLKLSQIEIPYLDLFIKPGMLIKTLCSCFNWFVISLTYYTLSLNTGNMGGNDFINCLLSAALEIPAYIFAYLALRKKGRRQVMVIFLAISAIACAGTPLINKKSTIGSVICAMTGKFFITCVFSLVYLFSAELFPTEGRNQGIGLSSMFARLGSVIVPYIIFIGEKGSPDLPYFVIGIFTIAAASCNLLLPETRGLPLPDTYEEAAALRGKLCKCYFEEQDEIDVTMNTKPTEKTDV